MQTNLRVFLLDDFSRAHGTMILNEKPLLEAASMEEVTTRSYLGTHLKNAECFNQFCCDDSDFDDKMGSNF